MRIKTILALIALTTSVSAAAEPDELPTGSRLVSRARPGPALSRQDQAQGAKRMAQCLFDRKGDISRAALLATSKQAADADLNRLGGELTCFGVVLSNDLVEGRDAFIPPDILRGMLAEAALDKSRKQVAALQPLPLQKAYQRPWFVITGRPSSVDEMGACVADTNPAGVSALISTKPATPEEAAAFGNITDNLGKCLTAGTQLHATPEALRAALAEALFQRVNAPAAVPAAETPEAAKK
jgi:hypothetical protein